MAQEDPEQRPAGVGAEVLDIAASDVPDQLQQGVVHDVTGLISVAGQHHRVAQQFAVVLLDEHLEPLVRPRQHPAPLDLDTHYRAGGRAERLLRRGATVTSAR
nr:hypothetical protein [Amycolatopsis eburnea]